MKEARLVRLELESATVRYMYDNHRDCFDDYARRIYFSGRNVHPTITHYDLWAHIYA